MLRCVLFCFVVLFYVVQYHHIMYIICDSNQETSQRRRPQYRGSFFGCVCMNCEIEKSTMRHTQTHFFPYAHNRSCEEQNMYGPQIMCMSLTCVSLMLQLFQEVAEYRTATHFIRRLPRFGSQRLQPHSPNPPQTDA